MKVDIEKTWALSSVSMRITLKILAVTYSGQVFVILIGGSAFLPVFGKAAGYGLSYLILSIIFMVATFLIVSIDKVLYQMFRNIEAKKRKY